MIRASIRLEGIDTHLLRRMQVPTRFGPKRLHMTVVALRLSTKQGIATLGRLRIKVLTGLWFRGRKGKLVEVQGGKLLRDPVLVGADMRKVGKAVGGRNGKLLLIIQARIEESAFAVHLKSGNERIPVGNRPPACPRMQIHSRQTERWREQRGTWHVCAGDNAIRDLLGIKGFAVQDQLSIELTRSPTVEHISYTCLIS